VHVAGWLGLAAGLLSGWLLAAGWLTGWAGALLASGSAFFASCL
jgi:hypothetical protein